MKTFNVKTWGCAVCGYHQDFDPINMPTHFPGIDAGYCPACWTGQNDSKTVMKSELEKVESKTTMTVMEEGDIQKLRDDGVAEEKLAKMKEATTKEVKDLMEKYEDV